MRRIIISLSILVFIASSLLVSGCAAKKSTTPEPKPVEQSPAPRKAPGKAPVAESETRVGTLTEASADAETGEIKYILKDDDGRSYEYFSSALVKEEVAKLYSFDGSESRMLTPDMLRYCVGAGVLAQGESRVRSVIDSSGCSIVASGTECRLRSAGIAMP